MMQPAQYRPTIDVPCPLNGARYWRILLQGEMRTHLVVVVHIRLQHMTKMPLAEHNNVVKTFSSDRTDQPLSISVLPWGDTRRPKAGRPLSALCYPPLAAALLAGRRIDFSPRLNRLFNQRKS